MKMKWVTFVLLGSLIGATYAHDSKNEDDQPTKLNLSSPSNYLKPLQDLKVETLKLATEMIEKNAVLKKKLSLMGFTNFPSFATLIHPSQTSHSEKDLGASVEFVHQIFGNLQKNVMGILFDLLEENRELERLLNERKVIRRKDRSFNDVLIKFQDIRTYVDGIQKSSVDRNVHDLDAFITGPQLKINTLLEIGRHVNYDMGHFSLAEIEAKIMDMLVGIPDTEELAQYDGHSITVVEFKGKVRYYFQDISLQFASQFWETKRESVRELCSRMVTLTSILMPLDPAIFPLLVVCISENQLTNGGCADGKVNRAFMLYLALLGFTGLGDEVVVNSAELKKGKSNHSK